MMTAARAALTTLVVALFYAPALAQAPASTSVLSNAEIQKILSERVDTNRQSPAIVVGVIDPEGRRVVAYGRASANASIPLDGDTVFEIGSMSKVFTSLLLAEAVQRGEVALTDPISKYLPSGVKVPERGRAITLQDLSTHTSGLPRLPDNMVPKDPENPYADYSVEQLYGFLSKYQLTRDAGATYEYSNLGAGLLGHILALRAGTDYESLVKARITGPLGMTSTAITLTPSLRARLAPGHDRLLKPAKNWDLPTLAGAGALRSSANDMLTFLAAEIGYTESPLAPAMNAMRAPRRPAGPGMEIALAWHVFTANGKTIFWHNGGTGGYRTYMGFDPVARAGVVVLTNAGSLAGPDDIGRHLLDPKSALLATNSPALAQPKVRTEITLAPATFDRYVGRYQLAPALVIIVTRDGARFMAQLTGQPAFEIFAETEKDFFYKVVDAQLTFETDAAGKTAAVVLHQNGIDQRAPRIEGDPVVPKEVLVDEKVLEGYVGRYDFVPGVSITITRQESRLYAQMTGQPSVEVFASSQRDFFYKVVNAQLTFEVGADGRATAVVLHQLGRDQRAARAN
jgi:CubicO group peptidase (beta-lactamase class C family)